MRSPVAKAPILCEWAGHFLETGSLHPPPAALRRFPCPPGFAPHSLPRTRRAGCPHPLQKVSLRSQCAHWLWQSASPCYCLPAGHFLPTAAESTQRTPPKPMVLESFARLGCIPFGKPPTTRTERAGLPPCFRVVSAPPSAGRSRGPALPWRGGDTPLRLPCGAMWASRPTEFYR